MWSILIGILVILGGLSGQLVLRGTNVSWPLVLIGLFLVVRGVSSIGEAGERTRLAFHEATREQLAAKAEAEAEYEKELAEELRKEEKQERDWQRLLTRDRTFADLIRTDADVAEYFDLDSDFKDLAIRDPHFRAQLVADSALRESLKGVDWIGNCFDFGDEFGFGVWCKACAKKRHERAERDKLKTRKPNPARVTPALFTRQQAMYEAVEAFNKQNPFPAVADLEGSVGEDWSRRRREVYARFLTPDEDRQLSEAHVSAQAIAHEAMQEAKDAGAEPDDVSEGRQGTYDTEMVARVPPVLRFYYE